MSADGYFQRLYLKWAPPWFLGDNGTKLLESIGAVLDARAEHVIAGRVAAIPYSSARMSDGSRMQCEADALEWHSRDRMIPLYATEPTASQRFRLSRWRQLRARKGTHRGELEHVRPYFLGADGRGPVPAMRIVHQSGDGASCTWHELDAAGAYSVHRVEPSNWNFDPHSDRYARFFFIVDDMVDGVQVPALIPPATWDGGAAYDDGTRWDGMRTDVALDLVSMLTDWQSADSVLKAVIVNRVSLGAPPLDHTSTLTISTDGWTPIPVSNWGSPVDWSTGKPTRPPYLDFIREVP